MPEQKPQHRPLAERMRPRRLEDFVGQEHLVGQGNFSAN
jgi:putative ATPase